MITREQVLLVLQRNGPSLPVQIRKELREGDTFIIGAVLTELREAGKVRVSKVKRGGSPFYYVPEHAAKLVAHIPDLGEKERRSAELLQEKGMLEDSTQMPLVRVTLREIKDYAVPVRVKINDEEKLFWKWYLFSNDKVEQKIKSILGIQDSEAENRKQETVPAMPKEDVKEEVKSVETPKAPPRKAAEPVGQDGETVSRTQEVRTKNNAQQSEIVGTERASTSRQKELVSEDEQLPQTDQFATQLAKYFAEKTIAVLSAQILRKNSDIELEISVPTPLGHVKYFCKAKNKKKSNEGDLSGAYVQGQVKKLPAIYLTTGEVTKKAREKLINEFKGLLLVELS